MQGFSEVTEMTGDLTCEWWKVSVMCTACVCSVLTRRKCSSGALFTYSLIVVLPLIKSHPLPFSETCLTGMFNIRDTRAMLFLNSSHCFGLWVIQYTVTARASNKQHTPSASASHHLHGAIWMNESEIWPHITTEMPLAILTSQFFFCQMFRLSVEIVRWCERFLTIRLDKKMNK